MVSSTSFQPLPDRVGLTTQVGCQLRGDVSEVGVLVLSAICARARLRLQLAVQARAGRHGPLRQVLIFLVQLAVQRVARTAEMPVLGLYLVPSFTFQCRQLTAQGPT